jgi:hypothetical protein
MVTIRRSLRLLAAVALASGATASPAQQKWQWLWNTPDKNAKPFSTEPSSGPPLGSGYEPGAEPETLAQATQAILTQCGLEGWQVRLERGEGAASRVELSPTLDGPTVDCVRGVLTAWNIENDLPAGGGELPDSNPTAAPGG